MAKNRTRTTETKQRARGPKGGKLLYDGRYLVGRETPRGMIITATEEGQEEARDAMGTRMARSVFFDMFEDWIGNGWTWIPPEAIGALTDGEIISPDAHIDDDGEIAFDTKRPRIYWFSDYQVVDPLEQWSKGKGIVFDLAKVESNPRRDSTRTELVDAGWSRIKAVPGTKLWFEGVAPDGKLAAILRQSSNIWHVFYKVRATASGHSPKNAHLGGLGDAVSTDEEVARYCELVEAAPQSLVREYDGLYAAIEQCSNMEDEDNED